MMKLALLGSDSQTLELSRSVSAGDEHEVVWTLDLGDSASEVEKLFPAAERAREWEPLLEGNFAEAVVVAHSNQDDQLIGQLRLLVQAAIPLLVSCRTIRKSCRVPNKFFNILQVPSVLPSSTITTSTFNFSLLASMNFVSVRARYSSAASSL